MTKFNTWEIVNKEAATIIKAIEKGDVKTRKEYHDWLEVVYNWRMTDAIETVVRAYIAINNIEMPWDNEPEEPAE